MTDLDSTVAAVAAAPNWNARVALLRRVPEDFGMAQHQAVYSAIAKSCFRAI